MLQSCPPRRVNTSARLWCETFPIAWPVRNGDACAALAGPCERPGGLRTSRRPALLVWDERGRRYRQNFPLGYEPMMIGLAVHAALFGPDLVSTLANAVLKALIHVRCPAD